MIAFHIVYIGDMYPYAKRIVYTFHMPAFLFISGYLLNVNKRSGAFFKTMFWLFVPYFVMECFYIGFASMLPVRDHVDNLTVPLLIYKAMAHPVGPYWYLHTLILCDVTYYAVLHLPRLNKLSRFILFGLCLYVYSYYLNIVSIGCAAYFFAGAVVKQSNIAFLDFVRPSALSIIPLAIIACYPDNLDKATVAGFLVTYLAMSFCLYVYRHLPENRALAGILFAGRNTLVLFLFSPIFTILAKHFIPLFAFDASGMLFLLFALVFTMAGCFVIAYIFDRTNMSRYFFGKKKVLQ